MRILSAAFVSLCLALLCPAPAWADDWQVSAEADRTELSQSEVLTYTIKILGEGRSTPKLVAPPALDDFVDAGTSTMSSLEVVNGRMTRSLNIIYRLKPRRSGTLRIPPVEIDVGGGERLTTNAVEIEVSGGGGGAVLRPPPIVTAPGTGPGTLPGPGSAPSAQPPPSTPAHRVPRPGEDWFLETEPEKEKVWLGEPFTVTYRFLRGSHLMAEVYDVQEPDFEGFWPRELNENFVDSHPVQQRAGKDYYAETMRTYVLVPIETGELTVSAVNAQVVSAQLGGASKEWIASPTASVQVEPLPSGAPAGFDISNVAKSVTLTATPRAVGVDGLDALRIGDSVVVLVELTAEGLVEQMKLAPLAADDRFLTFGPQLEGEELNARHGTVYGTRRFKLTFAPTVEGALEIPAVRFVYFDFAKEAYAEATVGPWPVRVSGHAPNADDVLAQVAARESAASAAAGGPGAGDGAAALRVVELEPVASSGAAPLYARPWYLALLALAPLAWLGLVVGGSLRQRRSAAEPRRRSRGAQARASRELRRAAKVHRDEPAAFSAALDRVLRDYVIERFEVRARSMTGEQLVAALRRVQVARADASALAELLEAAAAARYGGAASALPVADALERARGVLDGLERSDDGGGAGGAETSGRGSARRRASRRSES